MTSAQANYRKAKSNFEAIKAAVEPLTRAVESAFFNEEMTEEEFILYCEWLDTVYPEIAAFNVLQSAEWAMIEEQDAMIRDLPTYRENSALLETLYKTAKTNFVVKEKLVELAFRVAAQYI